MDAEPFSGVWLTYQGPHPSEDSSLSQKHYLTVTIQQGVGACELLPLPRWNVGQIDLLRVFLHVACLKIISMGSMLECLPTMRKALGSFPKASKINWNTIMVAKNTWQALYQK